METILLSISGLCGITASIIWFYGFAYARGYENGHHCGISQGLFLAKERENKRLSYNGSLRGFSKPDMRVRFSPAALYDDKTDKIKVRS